MTKNLIEKLIIDSSDSIRQSVSLAPHIEQAIIAITKSMQAGNKLVIFGNGGSAADAQHIAGEFLCKFLHDRKSYPAIALSTDSSTLTAIANDFSYDQVFARQCQALVKPGDIALGISTSGNSVNVLHGLTASKEAGATTIALLGNQGGQIKQHADISVIVPSSHTPHIQESHQVIYHIICQQVELALIDMLC